MIAVCPPASSNLSEYISFFEMYKFPYKLIKTIDDIKNNNDISMILLCGGSNISNSKRDILEFSILEKYYNKIPFIGICRGLQIAALYNNGEISKINNDDHKELYNISSFHKVIFNNIETLVNSRHQMMVSKVPKNFEIIAVSQNDNVPEILLDNKNIFVQFHPERSDMNGLLLKYLFVNYIKKNIYNKDIFTNMNEYNINKVLSYCYINDYKIVSFKSLKKNMCMSDNDISNILKYNANHFKKIKNKKGNDCISLI